MQNENNEMIDDFLVYFLRFYREMISLNDKFKEKISPEGLMILNTSYYENQPISVIAEQLNISRSHMTAQIDRLVKEDLVERIPDKNDRRMTRIILTQGGHKLREKSREVFEENWNYKLSSLSPEDVKKLYNSIETIKYILSKLQGAR